METLKYYLLLLKEKDVNTYFHSRRVAYFSYLVGHMLGYTNEQLSFLIKGALLHDIGKLYIPDSILKKRDRLTKEEFEIIKQHTLYAKDILKEMDPKLLHIICAHHERLDGSGYPYQLSGYKIPYCAQILAIADSFDAMTSNRNYNQVMSYQEALQELFQCSCNHCNLYNYDLVFILSQSLYINHLQNHQRVKHYIA